mmetsp:Transcript_13342/g.27034  ORF Transcript_13342/g.27034 Transcript_13342/m.27034 type:complete len:232 (+) Transcript_13342:348-1043(+)
MASPPLAVSLRYGFAPLFNSSRTISTLFMLRAQWTGAHSYQSDIGALTLLGSSSIRRFASFKSLRTAAYCNGQASFCSRGRPSLPLTCDSLSKIAMMYLRIALPSFLSSFFSAPPAAASASLMLSSLLFFPSTSPALSSKNFFSSGFSSGPTYDVGFGRLFRKNTLCARRPSSRVRYMAMARSRYLSWKNRLSANTTKAPGSSTLRRKSTFFQLPLIRYRPVSMIVRAQVW